LLRKSVFLLFRSTNLVRPSRFEGPSRCLRLASKWKKDTNSSSFQDPFPILLEKKKWAENTKISLCRSRYSPRVLRGGKASSLNWRQSRNSPRFFSSSSNWTMQSNRRRVPILQEGIEEISLLRAFEWPWGKRKKENIRNEGRKKRVLFT